MGLHARAAERPSRKMTEQIDIEFAPPLPPPAVEPEPESEREPEPEPEPEPVIEKPKPKLTPRNQAMKPVAARETPAPTTGSSLPVSDEGTLPPAEPGEGVPGPELVATPAPPPRPPPPPPPPVIEAREGANYKNNPRPPYPRLAQREGWEGKVLLLVRVTPQGRVAKATVKQSSGRSVLDEAALEVVKSWSFVPATQGGSPVAGTVSVPFEFHLN
jgi:periplasmic protein TonB